MDGSGFTDPPFVAPAALDDVLTECQMSGI